MSIEKRKVRYATLAFAGFLLFVAGVVMVFATVRQEKISSELSPEDYHMGIPTETYVVRSLNVVVTATGVAFMFLGSVLMVVSYKKALWVE